MRIAIIGAGIAGPTLAFWLNRFGHESFLLEQADSLRRGGYVIDFWGAGYEIACRMGLEADLRGLGYQVETIREVGRDGGTAARLDTSVFERATAGRFTSLARGDLAARLHAAVADAVETSFGDTIAAVAEESGALRLRLESGAERSADLLVGADGLHSRVRELVFGPESTFEHFLGYGVAACEVTGYRPREPLAYVLFGRPGRQLARFSLRGDRTLFLFVFRAGQEDFPPPDDRAGQISFLRATFGGDGWESAAILEATADAGDLYFDRVSQIRLDRWSRGRVALVGDAAASVSLLAGEGAGLAMVEAFVLAGELARAGGDWHRAFPAWERRLAAFVAGKQRSAERFARWFAPRNSLGVALRHLVMRAMHLPFVADFFVGRSLRDSLDLPDYGTGPATLRGGAGTG